MQGFRKSYLMTGYLVLLVVALMVGCTTKEDPVESMTLCGNHSCGNLVMVTNDTTSDGFQYLDPDVSHDGTRLAFTADWATIPTDPNYSGEPILSRQVLVMPIPDNIWSDSMRTRYPVSSITELGGELIKLQ